jgi:uncharacterized protein YkwD
MRVFVAMTAAFAGLLMVAPAEARPSDTVVEVMSMINAQRLAHGCAPLQYDEKLAQAAERESRDMATKHFYSHTEPDGTTPGIRVKEAGYTYQMIGENIDVNTDSPQDAVTAWLNSPGHLANILTCAFKQTWIAVVDQEDDAPVSGVPSVFKAYWTQVFAMPFNPGN